VSPVTRTRLLVVLSFAIAFAAGVSLGAVVSRPQPRPHGPSWLAEQLHLTPEQQKQMGQIWSGLMQKMRANAERRRAMQSDREEAIRALMNTPELQKQYDAIVQQYEQERSDLAQEGGRAQEDAKQQTLKILDEDQRKKWEQLMKSPGPPRQRGEGRGWGPPGRGPGRTPPPSPAGPAEIDHP
jgi:cell division protein ZapA (FtsZ GTPase activity inhibitor)